MLGVGPDIAVLLGCSKSSRQCNLTYLLTYILTYLLTYSLTTNLMQSCGLVVDHPKGSLEWEAARCRLDQRRAD